MSVSEKIKKNIGRGFLAVSFFHLTLLPMTVTFAQQLAPAKMSGISWICAETQAVDSNGNPIAGVPPQSGNCTFADLINAIKGITNFAVGLALAFSVVVIAIAGSKYLTSGGEPAKRQEANKMFEKVAWGIFWILAAWLVINLIMNALTAGTGVKQLLQ